MFTPRLTAPENKNPYYTKTTYGGYSTCILGNNQNISRPWEGSTLPNCVGYALGRFNEIGNYGKFKYTWGGNAEDFIEGAKAKGLQVGDEPQLGSIIVWQKGNIKTSADGCGHVAIVEEIKNDGSIVIAESGWSSKKVLWTATHRKGQNGQWVEGSDAWMKNNGYQFRGFIYNPAVNEEEEMTQEKFNEMMNIYLAQLRDAGTSSYAREAMEWATTNGLINGNDKGQLMSKSFLTREQFAVVLKRYDELSRCDCGCSCRDSDKI